MTLTDDLTIENFTQKTGHRFRMTKLQTARVALTKLEPEKIARVATMSLQDAADFLNAKNTKNGKPLGWVEEAVKLADGWDGSQALTREQAFQEFLTEDGPERLKNRKPELPLSFWLDPELSLDNFTEKAFALVGDKRRFRRPKEHKNSGLSREESFVKTVADKRTAVNEKVEETNINE